MDTKVLRYLQLVQVVVSLMSLVDELGSLEPNDSFLFILQSYFFSERGKRLWYGEMDFTCFFLYVYFVFFRRKCLLTF